MRKWKCIICWFLFRVLLNFINLRVVLMSNKRCGKVRLRQIYLNKREWVFVIFEASPFFHPVGCLPVRLKKSVMNFCSSWQMGSISLSTSRIVSEKRVLSAADKSIINDPKAQILLYKTGYTKVIYQNWYILEKNSIFPRK